MSTRRRSPPPSSSHYDYLLKIILLGPSGSGKTSLLHHFLHSSPLLLTSQTIGVEFASKILVLGSGSTKRRIKLQLWDTAGTERFRSVSRSYYRGAAGAVLVWDITSQRSFAEAETFLRDARVLGSRGLSVVGVGNKLDVAEGQHDDDDEGDGFGTVTSATPASYTPSLSSRGSRSSWASTSPPPALQREVPLPSALSWAAQAQIPVVLETSAVTGEGVQEVFERLARMVLTKIELGEVNPDDPNSGIQYGDSGGWGIDADDGRSLKSGLTVEDGGSLVGPCGRWRRRWETRWRWLVGRRRGGRSCG
ncbi:P-loop containing nucleoside triphosphate hydrolase protein [Elsinoe ampelina]|uniref:P-loop containing nucleoside triphosphate hydrolase protein n=1 Tax=Elsinoe ampelina TaxID=302913 RepID=A0A6A6GA87_9PEZI|nr:P-loop containing nucleoside triphosphate hydrolase protein [Elsinoe ampelina]